jgi:hypothetical protein
MKKANRHPPGILAVVATIVAVAAPAARGGIVRDDASGFLRDRPATAASASTPKKISRELICAEDCVVSGRLVIPAHEVARLGLGEGERPLEVGRFQNVHLQARRWRTLRVPITRRAERRLRGARVRVRGEAIGISVQSRRHGQAAWVARLS